MNQYVSSASRTASYSPRHPPLAPSAHGPHNCSGTRCWFLAVLWASKTVTLGVLVCVFISSNGQLLTEAPSSPSTGVKPKLVGNASANFGVLFGVENALVRRIRACLQLAERLDTHKSVLLLLLHTNPTLSQEHAGQFRNSFKK